MSHVAYVLTPELRQKLKQPLGILVSGSFAETTKRLKQILARQKFPLLITVGDTVSRNSLQAGIRPQLMIVDDHAMRKSVQPIQAAAETTLTVENPAGTITEAAEQTVCRAIAGNVRTKLIVNGEEDLLALVAINCAPENALVVYGQPHEGIVIVQVTADKKNQVAEILDAMRQARKG